MLSNNVSNNMRKLKDKNTRKLIRMGRAGGSLGLTLPKEITTELGWREKQRVSVKRVKGGIIIRDYRNNK